jgi:hypothetical protein
MGSCRIAAKFMALDKLYGHYTATARQRSDGGLDALLCRFAQSAGFEQSMEAMFHVPFRRRQ